MATIYRNGLVVSAPAGIAQRNIQNVAPADTAYGISFRAKQKILSAAAIQSVDLSNSYERINNSLINHVFLTLTFDARDTASYVDNNANQAASRFFENLKKTYGATSYVFVREFTKELVPHFHALVTMPYAYISELNRAWSHARGDIDTVKNALRTGWDKKRRKPRMRIESYHQAVGYAAKYISKANYGDISALRMCCNIFDRQTWEAKTGHKYRAYSMSQNLVTEPKRCDFHLQKRLRPWIDYEKRENLNADFYLLTEPRDAKMMYDLADTVNNELSRLKDEENEKRKLEKQKKQRKQREKDQKKLQKQLFSQ